MHSWRTAVRVTWPCLHEANGRLLGLPFVVTAALPGLVVGWQVCLAAAVLAILASFIVFVPLTALMLNGWQPVGRDIDMPPLTARAYGVLLLSWTGAAWLYAAAFQVLT